MELIESDLKMILEVFRKLEEVAAIENIHSVNIHIESECGDVIVVGYGENGDPAILAVNPEPEPVKVTFPNPTPSQPSYPNTVPGTDPLYPSGPTWMLQPNTADVLPEPPYINCTSADIFGEPY